MTDPLRLSYEIDCPVEHAYDVWTTRLSTWWPKGHSASGDPNTFVVLEPRLGGRIFELTFVGLGEHRTRLEIVHAGFERLGAEGAAWREANTAGWGALMPHYIAAATT